MSTPVSKAKNNILVSILLLIFVGQATASAVVFCSMPVQGMSHSMTETQFKNNPDHSAHTMGAINEISTIDQSASTMQDCYSDNGSCSMSGSFFLALPSALQMQPSAFAQQIVNTDYFMVPSQPLSSLYRPPIRS